MMKRDVLAVILPPVAVCRYACASNCAAPIGLFWVTGIVAMVYGFLGGPNDLAHTSWVTVGLGAIMWGIAVVWARDTIKGVDDDQTEGKKSSGICKLVKPSLRMDDSDPFDQIQKFNH